MKRTKAIIYLHPHFTISGGAGKFVLETGKIFSEKGYNVTIISIKADDKIIGEYKKYINFINIGGPLSSELIFWITFPWSVYKILKILKRYDNFVLFPQVFPSNWWGFIYKLFNPNTKLLWMCHEPSAFIHSNAWIQSVNSIYMKVMIQVLNPILSIIDKKLAQLSDLIIVNSYYCKNYAKKIYSFDDNKLKVVYLGADLTMFKIDSKKKKKKQILSVCRLTKFKNVDILIKAMKIIMQKGYEYKLVIIGDGEEKQNLKRNVKTLGMTKSVLFAGSVDIESLIKFYQESKLSVTCAIEEPFGLAIIESMACGTPVISTNSGGPAEIIEHDKTGFLILPKDPNVLANKMMEIFKNKSKLKKISKLSNTFAKKFNWKNTTNNIEQYLVQKIN